jgi:hypothetical protein
MDLLTARAVAATAAGRVSGGARVIAAIALIGHLLPFYFLGFFRSALSGSLRELG